MKIVDSNQMRNIAEQLKADGKTIVFTNGCFDILHVGHVRYLQAARELGDCLILGLNSDQSVRTLKGPTRPINTQADRAEVLSALSAVDYVVIFEEATAENLISQIKPAIYVKGGDYNIKDLPESAIVSEYGGQTILIPEVIGKSSSNIIKKIKKD
ncbi:D-glycero-beta-D-manno-heptose 1-phosphate adenylyltransferase [Pelosinus sp. IPA-1]|uniref:D-glycero-beta-D-manno-heptose 1-phosphate adenylyltransferase n=1 Tax=Pelosinus sp. IPA-1 TaxID=3029569 RepID=UPI0024361B29|nr:D-glycero-beta-D-manno-heptose 1-phosphate adenylyltransferase [Pelosinus sp. IPA-1]GMB01278.1 glycerol-3-phosphate cytidylyltransferase [Pelosinus sp. IPA-1]